MQYNQHPDFLGSLKSLYNKNGAYKGAAIRVLALLARVHYREIFEEQKNLLNNFRTTGENRIEHCTKYVLQNHCRLVTIRDNNTCTFLFVGTHEDTEEWLNKNKAETFSPISLVPNLVEIPITAQIPNRNIEVEAELTKQLNKVMHLQQRLKDDSSIFKKNIPDTNKPNKKYYNKLKSFFDNDFSKEIRVDLNNIESSLTEYCPQEAHDYAENLALYAEFLHQEIIYIYEVKNYLALAATIKS